MPSRSKAVPNFHTTPTHTKNSQKMTNFKAQNNGDQEAEISYLEIPPS
jgi:hypothetical protein